MVGYRDDRYGRFGTAPARLDDALAWVPARATAALVALARPGGPPAVARTVRRDAGRHPSPNAGVAEAAFAAALDLRLGGGENRYGGYTEVRPALGDGRPRPRPTSRPPSPCRGDVTWLLAGLLAGAAEAGTGGRARGAASGPSGGAAGAATPSEDDGAAGGGAPATWRAVTTGRSRSRPPRRCPRRASTGATAPAAAALGLAPGRGPRPVGQPQPLRPRRRPPRPPPPRRPGPLPRRPGGRGAAGRGPGPAPPTGWCSPRAARRRSPWWPRTRAPGWVDDPDFSLYRRHLPASTRRAPAGGPTRTTPRAAWRRRATGPACGTRPSCPWPPARGPAAAPGGRWARSPRRSPARACAWDTRSPPTADAADRPAPGPARLGGRRPGLRAGPRAARGGRPARLDGRRRHGRDELTGVLRARGWQPLPVRRPLAAGPRRRGLREALARQAVVVRDCSSFGLADHVRVAVPDAAGLERLDGRSAASLSPRLPRLPARW